MGATIDFAPEIPGVVFRVFWRGIHRVTTATGLRTPQHSKQMPARHCEVPTMCLSVLDRLSNMFVGMLRHSYQYNQPFGTEHSNAAGDLNNLAQLLQATNRLAEAEPLMARVVTIFEKSLGENHPNVATALNNLALLLQATNRLAEAEPLMRRMVEIFLNFSDHRAPASASAAGDWQLCWAAKCDECE